MGILGYIKNKIDSAIDTVVEIVSPQSTANVQETKKASKTQNIELVSQETQAKQKNEDQVEIKNNRSRENVYKLIEDICVEYNIDIAEAKKANLFEIMTGFSSEELAKMTEAELKPFIDDLKSTLSNRQWTFWKSNKGIENLKSIAKDVYDNHIDNVTGRSWWDNLCDSVTGKNKNLSERLKKAGFNEVNEENVIAFFQAQTKDAIESGNPKKIKKALDEALQIYGGILKNTDSPEQKAFLTAAIQELEAGKRAIVADMTIRSCAGDVRGQERVAKGVANNYFAMTCKKDALNQFTSSDDNILLSKTSFQHMSQTDAVSTLNEWKQVKMQANSYGFTTPEEKERLDSSFEEGVAGGILGSALHTDYDSSGRYDMQTVLSLANDIIEELGCSAEVYEKLELYLKSHPDELPKSTSEIINIINKATNNAYARAIDTAAAKKLNSSKYEDKTQTSSTNKKQTQQTNSNRSNKTGAENSNTQTANRNNNNTANETASFTHNRNAASTQSSKTEASANQNTTEGNQKQSAELPKKGKITNTQPVIKKGVKAIKEFAKDNNISTFELAIDSLNSSNLDRNTRAWALNEFKAASTSQQKVNFKKITNISNAKAAAECIDSKALANLQCGSFYINEAVEEVKEESLT